MSGPIMPRPVRLPSGPADVQRWLQEEREASDEYPRALNAYGNCLAAVGVVFFIGILALGLLVGFGAERAFTASFCAEYECKGNAPGECPLPTWCPPR